ncbi:MAG: M28 family metallopeptidase [Clostridium sp.]|uniref:M28 family metallopeptidase n=1 Tax=Clostridium sp. TaxID=1506 RepID=UPI003F3671F6
MKSKLYKICTIISAIIFIFFLGLRCSMHYFNSNNVKDTIAYLSSNEFQGRLCGTEENYNATNYITKTFEELNLDKMGETYKEGFQVTAPFRNENTPSLSINKNGKEIKSYKYGKDFKEDMINFNSSSEILSSKDSVNIFPSSISFKKGGNIFLFYISKEENFIFRSSFINDSPISFAVAITKDVYDTMASSLKSGSEISISLPYSTKKTEIFNVVSKIEGRNDKLEPLILTAHFDHMGCDTLGNIYNGALDNASGASFLIELSKYMSSLPKPNRDIIFVALNAEEFGLLGSNDFASKYKEELKGAKVINFDMIGAKDYPITFMSGANSKGKDSKLINDLEKLCNDNNLNFDVKYEDSSDHASFINNGFDSLTVSHSDVSKIHTPNDIVEFISEDAIDNAFLLTNKYIMENCYGIVTKIILNPFLHALSFIVFLLLISHPLIKKIDNSKRKI